MLYDLYVRWRYKYLPRVNSPGRQRQIPLRSQDAVTWNDMYDGVLGYMLG